MKIKKKFDFWILMTVLILLSLGIVMVFSASGPTAQNSKAANFDVYFYLKSQLKFALIGLAGMLVIMNIDYKLLRKLAWPIFGVAILLMILVLVPGIGVEIGGARRWIIIAGINFQPSEVAKFSLILILAHLLSLKKDSVKYFLKGFIPYLGFIGIFAVLLYLEPHMSGLIVLSLTGCIIIYAAGAKIKHFIILASIALPGLFVMAFSADYRSTRILSFLDPFTDPQGNNWQIVNSLYAIGSGGLFGRGLGQSLQKFLYIPEPQNDFILAVIAEELGFIGVLTIIILFAILFWRGIKVAIKAPDMFGSQLVIGIISVIAIQVIINIAVVTSSIPVTGMPLPFFSAGGTSLVVLLCEMGVVLNVSAYSNYERI